MSDTTGKKGISQRTVFIIIIILLLMAGGGTAYYYLAGPGKEKRKLKKEAEKLKEETKHQDKTVTDKPADHQPDPKASGNDNWPLKKGSVGERVLYLKRAVNRLLPVGYAKLKEDNVFDDAFYSTLITKLGTRYYPVTEDIWVEVMKKSNELVK